MSELVGGSAIVVGLSAHIDLPSGRHGGYDLYVIGNALNVMYGDGTGQARIFEIDGWDDWLHMPPERVIAVGWGVLPDDHEVIFLYDKSDDNFGYGANVSAPLMSEWCYAPFDIDPAITPRTPPEAKAKRS